MRNNNILFSINLWMLVAAIFLFCFAGCSSCAALAGAEIPARQSKQKSDEAEGKLLIHSSIEAEANAKKTKNKLRVHFTSLRQSAVVTEKKSNICQVVFKDENKEWQPYEFAIEKHEIADSLKDFKPPVKGHHKTTVSYQKHVNDLKLLIRRYCR